jgi:UDP-N-acetyl-D-mannosaminuronate dehydrogenase
MNVTPHSVVIVVGRGEVGRPLFDILNRRFECISVDIEPVEVESPCSVMHICYPFQIPDFIGATIRYIQKYQPDLTVIHSTVCPGTTRRIQEAVGEQAIAYSPVRGKHRRMESDMLRYKKFVAATRPAFLSKALDHLSQAGFKTATFPSPEVAELSKLVETTYLGVLVGWAQEVERFAARYGGTFEDVNAFIEEIDFLPSHVYPGHIGGHCVMPNIAILQRQFQSSFLDVVVESNKLVEEEQTLEVAVGETK